MKKYLFALLSIAVVLLVTSCKTKEVPGRRRAPRNCNSCTKWSYTPQENTETFLLTRNEA